MKTLIICDSNFGNTRLVADKVGEIIGGKVISVKDFKKSDLEGIELLIVGSPINGRKPTPGTMDFLESLNNNELEGLKATSFDTRIKFFSGDAKNKIAEKLKEKGAQIIISPQAFFVKGTKGPLFDDELKKAEKWAKQIPG